MTPLDEPLRRPCMPSLLGWEDDPECPLLLLSDLSGNAWPPPWTDEALAGALDAVRTVHAATAPLRPYGEVHGPDQDWWERVAADPEPLLGLGVVTRDWLTKSLPKLREHAGAVSAEGASVTHFDLRSDNISLDTDRAYVVDWSHACLGNPRVDLGLFLPGVAAEGGPPPEAVMPDAPDVAAWVAGCFAFYASKPHIPTAPDVRRMQRRHLEAALPWAIRTLGLEDIRLRP